MYFLSIETLFLCISTYKVLVMFRVSSFPMEFQLCSLMTHKYRGSIVVLSISKSVEFNKEQKEMISGF